MRDPSRNKSDVDTSQAAWERTRHKLVQSQRAVLDQLRAVFPEGLTGKEISGLLNKPFNAVSGRITELLEQYLVRKSNETRGGGHVIYLEPSFEHWETLLNNPTQPTPPEIDRAALKAEIVRLDAAGDCWGALRIAYEHNIGVVLELPALTV